MANRDAPRGLTPLRHMNGGTIRASRYRIASGFATSIFRGDLVKTSPGTDKQIAQAVAGDESVGVFDGVQYIDSAGEVQFKPFWPASTVIKTGTKVEAFVYDDPGILYEVQGDEGVVAEDIGQMADVVVGTGDTATGQSAMELDSSLIGATGQLKLIELIDRPDNAYGNFAKVAVLIAEHENTGAPSAT